MSRTLNQVIKDTAYEWVCTGVWEWEDPEEAAKQGFVQGAEWFRDSHEHHQIRMWQIKVFDDHENYNGPRTYTVPATSGRDAQLMAFILDRGIEDDRYGHSGTVERGEMELARMHTEIISSSVGR